MSKLELIRHLYDYNEWANNHLVAAAAQLDDDQLQGSGGASFDSIVGSLVHISAAQVGWLDRWKHVPNIRNVRQIQLTRDFAEARAMFDESHAGLAAFLAESTEGQMEEVVSYQNSQGQDFQRQLWQLLIQVANHGSYHRGEVALMLTALDHSPGDIDFLFWEFANHP